MLICCGKRQKSITFICEAPDGYVFQRIEFLVWCKNCKRTVMEVVRQDISGHESRFRRTDEEARALFEKLRHSVLFRVESGVKFVNNSSDFWLGYNEFGRKKKCYSNLSSLKNVAESYSLQRFQRLKNIPTKA